jgi:hypothetical protein
LTSFFAYTPSFHGGVNVAAADVERAGKVDIITGAGPGGGPHVRTFSSAGVPLDGGFFAYDPNFTGGVSVGAALGRIVTGAGAGGGPHVKVFEGVGTNPDGSTFVGVPTGGGFFAYDPRFTGGVWVAIGPSGIVTGPGSGGGPDVRTFGFDGQPIGEFLAYEAAFTAGVKVAALGQGGSGSTTSNPGGSTSTQPGGVTITHPSPGGTTSSG